MSTQESVTIRRDNGGASSADLALEFIRSRIVSGEFAPGMRLKERDLVEQIGVSRVPVREALRSLASEGFATHSPRRGMVVTVLEPSDLTEIFEVRDALEVFAVTLVVSKASDAEARELLTAAQGAQESLRNGDRDGADRYNVQFHDLLVTLAHNSVLERLMEPLSNRIHWLLRQNDDNSQVCAEHVAIGTAIVDRDLPLARELAAEHVKTSQRLAFQRLFGISWD